MNKKIIYAVICLFFISNTITSCSSKKSADSETTNTNPTLTCDECGTSFKKDVGVQLSGHSEVFCSSLCATRWGFNHGISVNQ